MEQILWHVKALFNTLIIRNSSEQDLVLNHQFQVNSTLLPAS